MREAWNLYFQHRNFAIDFDGSNHQDQQAQRASGTARS